MMDRRRFATLLAGSAAAPLLTSGVTSRMALGQAAKGKTVFYASVGPELSLYDIDVEGAALTKRSAVTLPANVQYAWPHSSRQYFYVVSSNGGPGVAGDKHVANALRIDAASGALQPGGLIVESSSGTMAEGLARIGALKGYRVIIVTDPRIDGVTRAKLTALGASLEVEA